MHLHCLGHCNRGELLDVCELGVFFFAGAALSTVSCATTNFGLLSFQWNASKMLNFCADKPNHRQLCGYSYFTFGIITRPFGAKNQCDTFEPIKGRIPKPSLVSLGLLVLCTVTGSEQLNSVA